MVENDVLCVIFLSNDFNDKDVSLYKLILMYIEYKATLSVHGISYLGLRLVSELWMLLSS